MLVMVFIGKLVLGYYQFFLVLFKVCTFIKNGSSHFF
ncbi:hypothetical protein LPM_1588 [Legionella pneumophila subsp. pneumophila str. Mississauga]|nr:hypothetical protein LPM_1588 [Legionella pneumophila subsp. pneumophila str. Mississauga]